MCLLGCGILGGNNLGSYLVIVVGLISVDTVCVES